MEIEVRELAGQSTVVLTPDRHYRSGRERLQHLRATGQGASSIDWTAIDAVKEQQARVFLFRGKSDDDEGSWAFASDLSRAEAEELGYLMAWTQLDSWIQMMRHGIVSFLHVEWGIREVLMLEQGRERVSSELRAGDRDLSDAQRRIRIWILERACSFLHTSLEDVVKEVLPSITGLLERRVDQAQALLKAIDQDP